MTAGEPQSSAAAFIRGSRWVFANTMPDQPHEYTIRDLPSGERSTCLSHESFEWFVQHIREKGERRMYGGRYYVYLPVTVDGETWRYWTMGWPVEETTIINRAREEDGC